MGTEGRGAMRNQRVVRAQMKKIKWKKNIAEAGNPSAAQAPRSSVVTDSQQGTDDVGI